MIAVPDTATSPGSTANRFLKGPSEGEASGNRRYLMVMNEVGFVYSHFWDLAIRIQAAGWEVIIAGAAVADPRRVLDAGMKFVRLKPTFGVGDPISETKSFFELREAIRSTKPDVLHLISLKNCLLGGILARTERVPALLCAVTGLGTLFVEDRVLYKSLRPAVINALRYVLAHKNSVLALENSDDKQFFIRRKVARGDRTKVIPGAGVAADAITPLPLPQGVPTVLYVSRMIKNKGVLDLMEAAKLLRASGLDFVVELVGDIDARNPTSLTREELKASEADGIVRWLGPKSNVPYLLGKARVFCLPTYYREGLPRVLIEASAAGRAIVTTDVPGCREVVIDGMNGYLVPPRNVNALAGALGSLLRNTEACERMGREGRHRFETHFTHRSVFDAFSSCYAALGLGLSV